MTLNEALGDMSERIPRDSNGGEAMAAIRLTFSRDAQIDLNFAGMLEMHLRNIPRKLTVHERNQVTATLICLTDVFLRRSSERN